MSVNCFYSGDCFVSKSLSQVHNLSESRRIRLVMLILCSAQTGGPQHWLMIPDMVWTTFLWAVLICGISAIPQFITFNNAILSLWVPLSVAISFDLQLSVLLLGSQWLYVPTFVEARLFWNIFYWTTCITGRVWTSFCQHQVLFFRSLGPFLVLPLRHSLNHYGYSNIPVNLQHLLQLQSSQLCCGLWYGLIKRNEVLKS